jgi:hypothetical protein
MTMQIVRVAALAASLVAAVGCSKSPAERVYDTVTGLTSRLLANISEKDASREVGALIAKLKIGPECDVYRRRLAEAGKGSPYEGATQHAITWTYKDAGEAGCVGGP